jgi:hypothetical protein
MRNRARTSMGLARSKYATHSIKIVTVEIMVRPHPPCAMHCGAFSSKCLHERKWSSAGALHVRTLALDASMISFGRRGLVVPPCRVLLRASGRLLGFARCCIVARARQYAWAARGTTRNGKKGRHAGYRDQSKGTRTVQSRLGCERVVPLLVGEHLDKLIGSWLGGCGEFR